MKTVKTILFSLFLLSSGHLYASDQGAPTSTQAPRVIGLDMKSLYRLVEKLNLAFEGEQGKNPVRSLLVYGANGGLIFSSLVTSSETLEVGSALKTIGEAKGADNRFPLSRLREVLAEARVDLEPPQGKLLLVDVEIALLGCDGRCSEHRDASEEIADKLENTEVVRLRADMAGLRIEPGQ